MARTVVIGAADENMTDKAVFRDWMQDLADSTIVDLARPRQALRHPRSRSARSTARSRRPRTGPSPYYTGPSEDFSRPGAMWWSVPEGQKLFGKWREKSTVYHEGVPRPR